MKETDDEIKNILFKGQSHLENMLVFQKKSKKCKHHQ